MTSPPISTADRNRFVQEIITGSGPDGISADDLQEALEEFIGMNIDAAAIELWHEGKLRMSWRDGEMIWGLT